MAPQRHGLIINIIKKANPVTKIRRSV